MLTYIIIGAVIIIAFCMFSFLRDILRWILFLPLAFLGGLVYNLIDIENLCLTVFASHFSPILGLIFGTIGIFLDFLVVTLIARLVCPSSKIGWSIAFSLCTLWALYNLKTYHTYVVFPFGLDDPNTPVPPIVWWHVAILFTSSLLGGLSGKGDS